MNIKKCVDVLSALNQGMELEWRSKGDTVWKSVSTADLLENGEVHLDFDKKEYRVKSGYRAYMGVDEFVQEAILHTFMLMKDVKSGAVFVPSVVEQTFIHCGEYRIPYEDLVRNYVWYDDGTPVGMKL